MEQLEKTRFEEITLQRAIGDALKPYRRILTPNKDRSEISFGDYEPPRRVEGKYYAARTEISLVYRERDVGNIVIICFKAGDGTGDESTYSLEKLKIPEEFFVSENPERVLPREKKGVYLEVAIPLGSIQERKIFPYMISLEQLTIDNPESPRTIKRSWHLGMKPQKYFDAIDGKIERLPSLHLTTWEEEGRRHGDPHAIFSPQLQRLENITQIVGFLTIKHPEHPLRKHLSKIAYRPEEE